jgi:Protein of unknown function (DUF2934)
MRKRALESCLPACQGSPLQIRTDGDDLDMSTRYNNGSHYENHQRAAELHDGAAHAHRVAEQHGQDDHLSGHEHSRVALEQSHNAYEHFDAITGGHGIATFTHDDIAALAHELRKARGCPEGSSDEDWFHAAEELRSRAGALKRPMRSEDDVKSILSEPADVTPAAPTRSSIEWRSKPLQSAEHSGSTVVNRYFK